MADSMIIKFSDSDNHYPR